MKTLTWAIASLIVALGLSAWGQSYRLDWSSVDGGGGTSAGGVYTVHGTLGQADAGRMSGGAFTVTGGFWGIVAAVVTDTNAPILAVTCTATNTVVVSWPGPAAGWTLQQCTNLTAGLWLKSGFPVSDEGTNRAVSLPSPRGNLFLRLAK